MDKTERETRDFMNVESFSQLPFIRPTPPVREKGSSAIRLFGKEFGCPTTVAAAEDHSDENNIAAPEEEEADKDIKSNNSRKFECHYCCRNFPTSQALGGHQNAHKRERQHAKRAHLQMGISEPHDHYGLISYSRLGSAPTLPTSYHSWNSSSSSSYSSASQLYASHGSYHQPQLINGSPLAWWRIPNAHNKSPFARERVSVPIHQQNPLFSSKDDPFKPLSAVSSGIVGAQRGLGYESRGSMHDHVSLDLHL